MAKRTDDKGIEKERCAKAKGQKYEGIVCNLWQCFQRTVSVYFYSICVSWDVNASSIPPRCFPVLCVIQTFNQWWHREQQKMLQYTDIIRTEIFVSFSPVWIINDNRGTVIVLINHKLTEYAFHNLFHYFAMDYISRHFKFVRHFYLYYFALFSNNWY